MGVLHLITKEKLERPKPNILTYTWLNPKIDDGWTGPDKNSYELFSSEEIAVVFAFNDINEHWHLSEKICDNLTESLGDFFQGKKMYVEKHNDQFLYEYLQQRKELKISQELISKGLTETLKNTPFYSYSHPDKRLLDALGVFITACKIQADSKSKDSAENYIRCQGYNNIKSLKGELPFIFTEFSGDLVFRDDGCIIPVLDAKISVINLGGEKAAENAANGLVSLLKEYDGPLLPEGAWWVVRDIYREEAMHEVPTSRSFEMRRNFFNKK